MFLVNHRTQGKIMHVIRRSVAALLAASLVSTGAAAQQARGRQAAPRATTVIVVRHAEKVTSNPLNQDPHLTQAGRQRALALYQVLKGRHVDAIITTQLKRTKETAQPTADSLRLVPEQVHMGHDQQASAAEVVQLIRTRHAGQTVLVVGHSTTVNKIIAALGGPALGDVCESAFSNLFTLVLPGTGTPQFQHLHYGAADPPAHECENGIHVEHHDNH